MVAELRQISKRYGRHLVLDDVTLGVGREEVVGLIGPNGAGKTTLLRIAAGLLSPSSGTVTLTFPPAPGTLRYFGGEQTLPGDVPVRRWQALWRLAPHDRSAGRLRLLSRGTRQRVGLEAAIRLPAPSLIILDEPWEGLDPDASRWLSDTLLALARSGTAVIVSSHRIHDLAEVCTRCVFLVRGRLAPEVVTPSEHEAGRARSARLFDAFDRSRGVQ